MQKISVEFVNIINGNEFSFKCHPNSPLNDAKEAIYLVLKEFGKIEDANNEALEKQKAEEQAKKDSEPEEKQQE